MAIICTAVDDNTRQSEERQNQLASASSSSSEKSLSSGNRSFQGILWWVVVLLMAGLALVSAAFSYSAGRATFERKFVDIRLPSSNNQSSSTPYTEDNFNATAAVAVHRRLDMSDAQRDENAKRREKLIPPPSRQQIQEVLRAKVANNQLKAKEESTPPPHHQKQNQKQQQLNEQLQQQQQPQPNHDVAAELPSKVAAVPAGGQAGHPHHPAPSNHNHQPHTHPPGKPHPLHEHSTRGSTQSANEPSSLNTSSSSKSRNMKWGFSVTTVPKSEVNKPQDPFALEFHMSRYNFGSNPPGCLSTDVPNYPYSHLTPWVRNFDIMVTGCSGSGSATCVYAFDPGRGAVAGTVTKVHVMSDYRHHRYFFERILPWFEDRYKETGDGIVLFSGGGDVSVSASSAEIILSKKCVLRWGMEQNQVDDIIDNPRIMEMPVGICLRENYGLHGQKMREIIHNNSDEEIAAKVTWSEYMRTATTKKKDRGNIDNDRNSSKSEKLQQEDRVQEGSIHHTVSNSTSYKENNVTSTSFADTHSSVVPVRMSANSSLETSVITTASATTAAAAAPSITTRPSNGTGAAPAKVVVEGTVLQGSVATAVAAVPQHNHDSNSSSSSSILGRRNSNSSTSTTSSIVGSTNGTAITSAAADAIGGNSSRSTVVISSNNSSSNSSAAATSTSSTSHSNDTSATTPTSSTSNTSSSNSTATSNNSNNYNRGSSQQTTRRRLEAAEALAMVTVNDRHRQLKEVIESSRNKKWLSRSDQPFFCFSNSYDRQRFNHWARYNCTDVCSTCYNNHNGSTTGTTNVDLWRKYGQHKFVVSPHGNGPDCGRTWEIMLMGAIPIIPYFAGALGYGKAGLDVIIIRHPNEINSENVTLWNEKYKGPNDLYKLSREYWTERAFSGFVTTK